MDVQKFEELLRQPESDKLDFKETFNLHKEFLKKEFAKDVSAIANSKGGRGYLVFGVKDKTKEIVGTPIEKYDEEKVQQVVGSRVDPPIAMRYETFMYNGKNIAVVTIFKSDHRPHQILQTGCFYLRRGSTTDIARRHEVANMMQESGLVNIETTLAHNAFMSDIDMDMVGKYVGSDNSWDYEKLLIISEALGFARKDSEGRQEYRPTIGGLLLFGKNPQVFLINTGIQLRYKGITSRFTGNIPEVLNGCEKMLTDIFGNTGYPLNALLEALYNAIVHRDYWDNARDISISIEENFIEIINPGALWDKRRIFRLDDAQLIRKRNPWLYQRLLMFDKKQRFINTQYSLENIKNSFKEHNNVKFINIVNRNIFKIVLPGTKGYI